MPQDNFLPYSGTSSEYKCEIYLYLRFIIFKVFDKCICSFSESRVRDYVLLCMTSERSPKQNEAPLALISIQEELKILAGRFARIINHNRNVYLPFYSTMINEMLEEIYEGEKENDVNIGSNEDSTPTQSVK